MNNEQLIEIAIQLLQGVDEPTTDTVEIQSGQYSDGSTMLTINVAFLIPEQEKEEPNRFIGADKNLKAAMASELRKQLQ